MAFLNIYIIFFSFLTTTQLDTLKEILAKAELEIYIEEKRLEINPRYKLHYHITPPVGWMNGPNGFLHYNGEYHLFYQFYPYDTQWGPLHWGHVASADLVEWRQMPPALLPGKEECFSGSAINNDGIIALIYTGHEAIDQPPFYKESQYLAFSMDGVDFHKYRSNPIFVAAPPGTQDFRNPKIWKYGNFWYIVIGSKTDEQRGAALLYRSTNMINWFFINVLAESNGNLGFMWECPDFFELNGKYVLLISPQGMAAQGDKYRNTFQTGYIIGSFNYKTLEFVQEVNFQELDYGHDFYATQTTEKDGKRYLVAWFGMWETAHPEDADGWVGAMTMIRELDLIGTRILMKPVDAIATLRMETIFVGEFRRNFSVPFYKTGEMIVNVELSEGIELEFSGSKGGDKILLQWDEQYGKIVLDRLGDVRQVKWDPLDTVTWRIFLDASSFEIFCGEGEVVLSSRVYPKGDWRVRNVGPQSLNIVAYRLSKTVP